MRPSLIASLFVGACVACVPPNVPLPAVPALSAPVRVYDASADVTRASPRVGARAPSTVDFAETVLGLDELPVTVTVTNEAPEPIDAGDVHVRFHVRRGGVEFPCVPKPSDRLADHAGTLAPGQSFALTRSLGCWTPLPGSYAADAEVSFAGAAWRGAPPHAHFAFEVVDPGRRGPREIPSRPGLFAIAGGSTQASPVTDGGRDGYEVTVVLVNAGALELPSTTAIASLRVYAIGSSIPCTGDAFERAVPRMAVGAVEVLAVPVTCIRDMPGQYELVVHLAFPRDTDEGLDVGRVGVLVGPAESVDPFSLKVNASPRPEER